MNVQECYICGGNKFKECLHQKPSMASDGRIVDFTIIKEECQDCGTVRTNDTTFLADFYKSDYELNTANIDPVYIYNGNAYKKSAMHYEWINKLLAKNNIDLSTKNSIMEIGCGSGNLLSLFDVKAKFGVEPSEDAAHFASKYANIRNTGFENILDTEKYDIVLSTCVLEHTTNPNLFLQKNNNILNDEGIIILGIPIQNAESFDVFFLDHLHHFTVNQLKHLCSENNLHIIDYEIGYMCIQTIAYFLIKKISNDSNISSVPVYFEKNTNFILSKKHLDSLNTFLETNNKKFIVAFGYGETSFFFQTYSDINKFANFYIDDVKANNNNVLSIKNFALKNDLPNEITIILLVNPHYSEYIIKLFADIKCKINFYNPLQ